MEGLGTEHAQNDGVYHADQHRAYLQKLADAWNAKSIPAETGEFNCPRCKNKRYIEMVYMVDGYWEPFKKECECIELRRREEEDKEEHGRKRKGSY